MKRFIITSLILLFISILSFGQNGTNTIYVGLVTPVSFVEPQYEYFVGDIEKEQWGMGYSIAYSSFAIDSTSKFEFGAYLAINYSQIRNVEISLDTCTEFNYYGIATVQNDYAVTNATVSGEAFSGDLLIVEMQPTMRMYPISNRDFYVQAGINFSYLNRNIKDKIHNFVDENTQYVQSDLNIGVGFGAGYNYKMFTITPNYKFIFTNGMHHYGSLMVGFNF